MNEYKPGDEVHIKLKASVDFLHAKVVMKEEDHGRPGPRGYYVTILVSPDEMSPYK